MPTIETNVLDCGHPPTPQASDSITTGIAHGSDGLTKCFTCAAIEDLRTVRDASPGDRLIFYVSPSGLAITNWTGFVLMRRVVWGQPHPFSTTVSALGQRRYLSAVDRLGRVWSGSGSEGCYASLRLTKQSARGRHRPTPSVVRQYPPQPLRHALSLRAQPPESNA